MAGGTYVEISAEEMDRFIKRNWGAYRPKRTKVQNGIEAVYTLQLSRWVGVKILSSIPYDRSSARDVGSDSIKVLLISLKDGNSLQSKDKRPSRVNRTTKWKDALEDRVGELIEYYDDNPDNLDQYAATRGKGKIEPELEAVPVKTPVSRPSVPSPAPQNSYRHVDPNEDSEDLTTAPSEESRPKSRGGITMGQATAIFNKLNWFQRKAKGLEHAWAKAGLSEFMDPKWMQDIQDIQELLGRQDVQPIFNVLDAGIDRINNSRGYRRYASQGGIPEDYDPEYDSEEDGEAFDDQIFEDGLEDPGDSGGPTGPDDLGDGYDFDEDFSETADDEEWEEPDFTPSQLPDFNPESDDPDFNDEGPIDLLDLEDDDFTHIG